MTTPWTPGPWFEDPDSYHEDEREITADSRDGMVEIAVVVVNLDEPIKSEQRANIRLIVAAPEMAEMISETHRTLTYLRDELTGRIEDEAAAKFFRWADSELDSHLALLARVKGETP